MLTCDCGARFEVEDTLAGQEVACPECQQPVKVPARHKVAPRTSAWALASVVVALVGAFTPATLVAVGLGLAALASIARNRGRVTGTGFAVFGIVLGLGFAALTGFALSTGELFGLGGWVRERTLAQQVDTGGPLEVVEAREGFAITRPSEKWGRVPGGRLDDVVVAGLQKDLALLLVQPSRYALVDVRVERGAAHQPLDRWQDEILKEFEPTTKRHAQGGFAPGDDEDDLPVLRARAQLVKNSRLDEAGRQGREMLVDVRLLGQKWLFLIRLYRRGAGPVYVLRAYTQARRFAALEPELRQALDSFRILDGR
jgi:hypothetical protein